MKHFFAVLLAAITAGLVSCQVASQDGVKSIPATLISLKAWFGGAQAPVAAKIDASVISARELKDKAKEVQAKAGDAVAAAKEKFAEVKDKAIEAAAPSSAPAPAKATAAEKAADDALDGQPAMNTATGITHFYGRNEGTAVAAWSDEAAMNPDYVNADATAVAEPEATAGDAEGEPQAAPEAVADSEAVPVAEPAAPVSLGGAAVTSFFGDGQTADAGQPWSADATVFAEAEPKAEPEEAATEAAVAPAAAAPVSLGGVAVSSYFGDGQTADAGQPWSAEATVFEVAAEAATQAAAEPEPAAPAAAPVSLGGVGVTSYFGAGQTPDAGKPFSAEATVYSVAAEPAAAPAAPAAVEAAAPVSLGGVGVTSYFGNGQTPDDGKPFSAPATVFAQPAAAPAASPSPSPQAAPAACSEALAAALKAGTLNFVTSSWQILPDSYKTLDKVAALAKGCNGVMIEVAGHTDNTGKPASNQTLSDLRAQAVVKYLTGAGVDAGKLKAVGYGQDKPVASNDTADGKRQNRRIEFGVTAN
jgi:outer membrane protein OmpA-like peptidoglycan-associated protein